MIHTGSTLDNASLLLALLVAAAGTTAILRIFAGMIDHATRAHDTRVRVAELQINYLNRARAFRAGSGEVIEVGEDEGAAL